MAIAYCHLANGIAISQSEACDLYHSLMVRLNLSLLLKGLLSCKAVEDDEK
jgi:hypothetical protein